jgi:putative addiction module killer protein
MIDIRYYVDADGDAPFAEWFADLEAVASARVARAIARMEQGNFSNAKGVGEGVLEYKIDFWPGLSRVFWARPRHDRHLAYRRHEEAAATGY